MQINTITKNINIEENKYYYAGKSKKYIIYILEISKNNERYHDGNEFYTEVYCKFYRVKIFDKFMHELASNSVITFDRIFDGRLKYFIPNLAYDSSYFGNINVNNYQKEFKLWRDMIKRCYDPYDNLFKYIGALGTIVCDRWLCFEYFLCDLKHIYGWQEAKNDFYQESYIIDLYDCQRFIKPENRIYGPGLVKLKKFRNSDICKYLHNNIKFSKYPFDEIRTNELRSGKIPKEYLYNKISRLDICIDTAQYTYKQNKASMINPYISYAYNIYSNQFYFNPHMKEMCTIVEKKEENQYD